MIESPQSWTVQGAGCCGGASVVFGGEVDVELLSTAEAPLPPLPPPHAWRRKSDSSKGTKIFLLSM
nr:hypothetical protein [Variovorax paradoxus]